MRRSHNCPSLDELLLASERELPRRRYYAVTSHLRGCSACRQRLADFSRTIDKLGDADDALTAEALSRDWSSFHPKLRAAERARVRAALRLPSHRWLAVAATLTIAVLAALISDRYATVVTAEELLNRAVSYEQAQPALTRQRVRIRLTPPARSGSVSHPESGMPRSDRLVFARGAMSRPATLRETDISMVTEAGSRGVARSAAMDERLTEIARRLEQDQYPWDGRLRAGAFYTWRSTLRDRTDSVFRPSVRLLGLRTTTPDGWLRQAVLVVREVDYQPVRQVLTFADDWELSIEELASWLPAEPPARVAVAPEVAPKPAAPAPGVERLEEAEIAIREALYELEADWREGLSVRRTPSNVVIEGRVPSQTRENELKTALALPEVLFNVDVDRSAGVSDSLAATSPALDIRLARVFPDPGLREAFVPRAVTLVAELEARSLAFERLARRYPIRRITRLSDAAREKVRALAARHHRGLIANLDEIDRHFAPVLGTATRLSPSALSGDWQSIPGPLFSAARLTKDRILNWVFSRDPDPDQATDAIVQKVLDSCWALVEGSPVRF